MLNGHLFLLLGMNMILTTNCVIRLIGSRRMVCLSHLQPLPFPIPPLLCIHHLLAYMLLSQPSSSAYYLSPMHTTSLLSGLADLQKKQNGP
jgi:hypothetical protein